MLRTAIKFGVFTAVCLGFTLWLGFVIGNIEFSDPLGRDNFTLSATFDDVTGLLVNDDVKVAGVKVGKVTGIHVESGQAIVTFRVDNSYRNRLPSDTSADIRWRNLIGQRYLYLQPGTASTTLEPDTRITDTGSVTDLGELFNTLGPIVASIDESQVNEFIQTVSDALEGNTDALGQTLDDLATVSAGLASRDQAISSLIEDLDTVAGTLVTRDQQIRTLLDNLAALAGTFSANTDVVNDAITEFSTFSTDLSTLIENNRDEINRIIGTLDVTVAEQVVPRLDAIDHALSGLDEFGRAVFNVGRNGEWLNQTILCGGVGPPPCLTPIIPGVRAADASSASSGSAATSHETGLANLNQLVGGDLVAASGVPQ